MKYPKDTGNNKGGHKDDIVVARCQGCGEEIYYLVNLKNTELQAVESLCPTCGYRNIGLTGELKLVEELLHNAVSGLKQSLQSKGINASIEIKISLDDTGTWLRVKDSAFCYPDPNENPC